ncbi:iron-chelator esterase [Bacillus subtilis]|nr:iron-chelator esterase [Bacillus subtilis]
MKGSLSEHKAGNRRFTLYLPPSYSTDSGISCCLRAGWQFFVPKPNRITRKRLSTAKLPELVLIGIEPENRLDEYTPWPAASLSDRFTDFGGMDITICLI